MSKPTRITAGGSPAIPSGGAEIGCTLSQDHFHINMLSDSYDGVEMLADIGARPSERLQVMDLF